jgi:GTP-binding protein
MIIRDATFVTSAPTIDETPAPDRPEICFAGRSNVGKSSIINAITGRKKLAKTSGTPGKTRLLNYFDIDGTWYLVDMPGFGYAKVSMTERKKWDHEMARYLTGRENLKLIMHLIDARHDPTALDEAFISQLVDHRLPFCLLLTKTDTLSGNKIAQRKAQIRRFIKAEHIDVPMIMTSAVTGLGLDETRALIHDFITDKYQLSQSNL